MWGDDLQAGGVVANFFIYRNKTEFAASLCAEYINNDVDGPQSRYKGIGLARIDEKSASIAPLTKMDFAQVIVRRVAEIGRNRIWYQNML